LCTARFSPPLRFGEGGREGEVCVRVVDVTSLPNPLSETERRSNRKFHHGNGELPGRHAAITRWNGAMQKDIPTGLTQTRTDLLGEKAILKTPTAENNIGERLLVDNAFGPTREGVVKFSRDSGGGNFPIEIKNDRQQHRPPIAAWDGIG